MTPLRGTSYCAERGEQGVRPPAGKGPDRHTPVGIPRILLAYSDEVAREGTRRLLDVPDLAVVGVVGGVAGLGRIAARARVDVVVTELFLGDGDVGTVAGELDGLGLVCGIVVTTRFPGNVAGPICVAAGVDSCLGLDAPVGSLRDAVRAAAQGTSWRGVGVVRSSESASGQLEAQVLAELASGATNTEIADRLGYSEHYIKDVVLAVRQRLGARDRSHAAALAVLEGRVRPLGDGRFAAVSSATRTP